MNIRPQQSIMDLIFEKDRLAELKRIYSSIAEENLGNDFNNTSLIIYHAADQKDYKHTGQFLTGDANLNFKYQDIIKHYMSCLNDIFLVLVPHHGSANSWNKEILKDIPNALFWVISAGLNHKKHPGQIVLIDLFNHGKETILVDENNNFYIKFVTTQLKK